MLSSANESIGTGSADTPDFCVNNPPFHIRENNDAATSSKAIKFSLITQHLHFSKIIDLDFDGDEQLISATKKCHNLFVRHPPPKL